MLQNQMEGCFSEISKRDLERWSFIVWDSRIESALEVGSGGVDSRRLPTDWMAPLKSSEIAKIVTLAYTY